MDAIFGCNLWLIAGEVYDSYILYLYFYFKPVICSRVFFTAAQFSSLFASYYLIVHIVHIGIYCCHSLIVVYSLYLTSDLSLSYEHLRGNLDILAANNATYLKWFWRKSLKKRGKGKFCSVKHSYHTYILQAISQKVDCYHFPSQNSSSNLHVITLIEHVLDNNDALFFQGVVAKRVLTPLFVLFCRESH